MIPAAAKTELHPVSTLPVPINGDVFYSVADDNGTPYSFVGTARALLATTAQHIATATTFESGPTFQITFSNTRRTQTWTTDGPTAASFQDLTVAIAPQ